MRPRLPLLTLALACACATTGANDQARKSYEAADFTLNTVDGRKVSLSDHLGRDVVLINFWATWCTPCVYEMPHLQALYEKHKDEGFIVLGVAMDGPETIASVAPFVRRHSIGFPVLLDEETRAVSLYNPQRAAPFNVLIDRSGRVVSAREGFNAGDEKSIEAAVVALLGEASTEQPGPDVSGNAAAVE
ncbi:MAG: peroxiredoxin family protein [Myxococcales bacterium]